MQNVQFAILFQESHHKYRSRRDNGVQQSKYHFRQQMTDGHGLMLFSCSKLYAEKHSDVSILYADVVNFTQMTTQLPVRLLVETLHELFVKFDEASAVSLSSAHAPLNFFNCDISRNTMSCG
jgi:class 3 adenylate cyclase